MLVTNQTTNDYWFGPLHLAAGVGQTLTVDDTSETSLYLTDDAVADALNALYAANKITVSGQALPFPRATGVPSLFHGDGSPEGLVYGQGSLYMRRDSTLSTSTLYTKLTGVTTSTGWAAINVPTATRVTALPTTPFDLEQVVLNLNASYPGVEWQCTYNSSTGYWDAIGPPVTSYIDTRETTSSNSPADLSTVGPTVVLPYEGDYVITAGAYFGYSSGVWGSGAITLQSSVDGTIASPLIHIGVDFNLADGGDILGQHSVRRLFTGLNAATLKLQYYIGGSPGPGPFSRRFLTVEPVRLHT